MRRSHLAFTLIELLVSVAIIAVLMAILMPSLGRARESAKSVKCLSNLKQIGIGTLMYVQDNMERYPALALYLPPADTNSPPQTPWVANLYGASSTGNDKGYVWTEQVFDYMSVSTTMSQLGDLSSAASRGVRYFSCPSDPLLTGPYGENLTGITFALSYAMNTCRSAANGQWDGVGYNYGNEYRHPNGHKEANTRAAWLPNPGNTFIYVDANGSGWRTQGWRHANGAGARAPRYNTGWEVDPYNGRHNGKYNWAFCDGHVETLDVFQTIGRGNKDLNHLAAPKGIWTKNPDD